MLVCLTNVLGSFQDYVKKNLTEKLNVFVIIYLDNIFVYIEDSSYNDVKAVWWVLEALKKYGLYTNLKKCCFYQYK